MFIKQRTFEYRNKPNKYLAKLFTQEKRGSIIPYFIISETKLKDKLAVFEGYYERLYGNSNPEGDDTDKCLDSIIVPKIKEEHRQVLNHLVTVQEIDWSINRLKLGKTPGLDGLTGEVYKTFKDQVSSSRVVCILYKNEQNTRYMEDGQIIADFERRKGRGISRVLPSYLIIKHGL